MKLGKLLYTVLLISLFHALDVRAENSFVVEWPPDTTFVENEVISIVLKVDRKKLDMIRVGSDKNDSLLFSLGSGDRACFGITLTKGLNSIELFGLKKGTVVERKNLRVFFRSALFPKFREAPAGFVRYFFHAGDNETRCAGCHVMEPSLSSLRPGKPEKSPCFTCHARKCVNSFVHKPAAQWMCFTCHEVLEAERKYTTPKPDQKVCAPCHSYQLNDWKSKKIMHGPTAVGNCTLCHNPHGSDLPDLLRMQTTDLCVNCHQEKASGAHVIAGFYGKGHPVRGVKHPFKADREFTCAGCHNPHAGDTQNLLNHDISDMTDYCTLCHKM
ncbi:cytochrome c3 family protein [Desulforhopalus sp. IMCC35007]|uniref:cytochrome c3 family protein n=1 Tax=Desulforhopalus sp. IMCC35007 TaxID=2569543 RepID=UPI0010AE9039|nr:cytochrome c3 family protein [Desulforhopalus sp. IMCC35007]TKB11368.1 hypothetical protein FCL48_05020 [Desulforhopalus sp. IMCC35007]